MSLKNRKAFEDFVIDKLGRTTKGKGNAKIYRKLFDQMNNAEFEKFIEYLENGGELAIFTNDYLPGESLEYNNLLKLCTNNGIAIETRLVIEDEVTGITSLSPYKAMVGRVECRKQRQMLAVKFSHSKDDSEVDALTGQATGESRATSLGYPELNTLRSLGLHIMANELYNVKGGDEEAFKTYKNDLLTTGKSNTNSSLSKGKVAKALDLAHYLLRARMLDNNLNSRTG